MTFTSDMGTTLSRITLQNCKEGSYSATVESVNLIKADGTKQKSEVSVFWGCAVTEKVESDIHQITYTDPSDHNIYNLKGQRILSPAKGIYIQGGRKYVGK